jgi:hypothetical protein
MALAHYGSQGHPVHSLLPRSGMRTVPKSVGIPDGAPVEPIRTMVSCRFKIRGKDTEAAVSDSFDECLGRIIYILNNCTAVLNSLLGPNQDHLSPVYSRSTFGTAYILVRGLEGRGTCHRIMLNGARVVLNTSTLSKRQIRRLNDHIAGDRSIHEAEQFVQSGYYYMQNELLEIALLHIMIGIELATTRLVTGRLSKQGVSKSKMKGAKRDLTFSMMLNILLPSLNPKRTPLPEQWISQINWGRQRRNDFMHEGKVRLSKEEIRQLFDAGVQFLDFFREYI